VDAYGTQQFVGTVDSVRLNATTVNNVVTYPVWINVLNPDLKLRPSMTANLKIIVDKADNVIKVPNQALRFKPTSIMYTWLGMTPPAAGRGRGANAKTDAQALGGGGPNAGPPGPGQGAGPDRGRRGGFGRGVTSDQTARFQQGAGGRGDRGRGGRGARGEQSGSAAAKVTPAALRDAAKIDDLFEAVPKRTQSGQVWLDDEKAADANKRLRQVNVRVGLTDGQFSELVSSTGETLTAGTLVVTGVVPPASALPKPGQNLFQQNPRGGFGPGGPGGPGPGGGRGD
jgi:HlyD family secretion protein